MFPKIDGLGEKTLNKIAEMALQSQLNQADYLSVKVKTDPQKLAKGMLESIAIDGKGLVMQPHLRMEEMTILIQGIAVSPLKALMGNIQLTEPTQGHAAVVLTEKDLDCAVNTPILKEKIAARTWKINGHAVKLQLAQVNCKILKDGKIAIALALIETKTQECHIALITAIPQVKPHGEGVSLTQIHYLDGQEICPELTKIFVKRVEKVLSLKTWQMEGIVLQVSQCAIAHGKICLQADAHLSHFPNLN